MAESVRPDRSPAERLDREWLRETAEAVQTLTEAPGNELPDEVFNLMAAALHYLAASAVSEPEPTGAPSARIDALALIGKLERLNRGGTRPSAGTVEDVIETIRALLAVSEGPVEASVAGSANTAETREGRDPEALLRFIDAVSPFVRDVLDEPFPWQQGGQVIVWMSREEYDEAVAALEGLRD